MLLNTKSINRNENIHREFFSKNIPWNKSVQKTVVKIHEICQVRPFTDKITATVDPLFKK